ncbi:MAG: hypothetical protein VYC95_00580 [Verrucomicrobiota bacterium]|nr:hypothetical protein [Verrucomicrobiota bacterium]
MKASLAAYMPEYVGGNMRCVMFQASAPFSKRGAMTPRECDQWQEHSYPAIAFRTVDNGFIMFFCLAIIMNRGGPWYAHVSRITTAEGENHSW